jgi:flotillin
MEILSKIPIVPIAIVIAVILLVVIFFYLCYKKCPPNKAMVITGPRGTKTIIGKACFIIPFIQRADYMSLENIQVDFTSRDEIPTKDAINVLVDAVANMSISKDPDILKIASSKFLGYSTEAIQAIVTPVLEGNIREIISQTSLKELIQGDKKVFAERVVENVAPNLRDMGLELTTFNIQNFKDKNGVIDNLGIENTVQISKDAKKAQAAAQAEIAIAQAQANKEANEAEVASEAEIAKRNTELAIQKSELKKQSDIKKAEAEAAKGIQAEEQRKVLEISTANANLAKQEKEIELKEREVSIKEKALEADVKKTAEAQKYAAQQEADARLYTTQKQSEAELFERQKKAEAEKFEAEQSAEATKATSEAQKIAMENEAAGIRAKGEAEAAAIQAKAIAEAEGISKKAEAMKLYGESAQMDMKLEALKLFFEQLPAIAQATGEAYTNVDRIVMLGGDSSKLTGDIINNVTQITEGVSESLGIDLKALLSGFLGGSLVKEKSTDNTEDVLE